MIYKLNYFAFVFFIEYCLVNGQYWNKIDPKYLTDFSGQTKIVALKSLANGLFVCAENVIGSPLIANKIAPKITELFELIANKADGTISLRAIGNSKLVEAQFYGPPTLILQSVWNSLYERFYFNENSDGTISFKTKWLGNTISVDNNGVLFTNKNSIGKAESFFLIDIPINYIIQLKVLDNLAQCVAQADRRFITLQSAFNGKYICASFEPLLALAANKDVVSNSEIYELFDNVDDGTVSLRSYGNNRFVSAECSGMCALKASCEVNDVTERFFVIKNPDETISLIAKANGKYVSAGFYNYPTNLIANEIKNNDQWERFKVTALPEMDNVPFNDRVCERNGCMKKCCMMPYMKMGLRSKLTGKFVGMDNINSPLWAIRYVYNRPGYSETFKLFGNSEDSTISLKFMANNKFVSAPNNVPLKPISDVSGASERYVLITNPDNTVSLRSSINGLYVAVRPTGFMYSYVLVANSNSIGPAESFDFVCME